MTRDRSPLGGGSTVAIFGRGPRFHLRPISSGSVRELLAARSSCLVGGVPELPSRGLRAAAQDALLRSAFRTVAGRRPLQERG
jgi:hypothetical protein